MPTIDTPDWITRCAHRIGEIDDSMSIDESIDIAREIEQFERTRAMAPEAAVDLVAQAIAHPGSVRLERRLVPR